MKRKEMIQLVVAVVILTAAGYLIYNQLKPPTSASTAAKANTIPKVTPISPDYDSSSLGILNDSTHNQDFYQAPDLHSGLGNNQPFGTK